MKSVLVVAVARLPCQLPLRDFSPPGVTILSEFQLFLPPLDLVPRYCGGSPLTFRYRDNSMTPSSIVSLQKLFQVPTVIQSIIDRLLTQLAKNTHAISSVTTPIFRRSGLKKSAMIKNVIRDGCGFSSMGEVEKQQESVRFSGVFHFPMRKLTSC